MHRGFGTILKLNLMGSDSPRRSRSAMLTSIKTYFTEAFNAHVTIPCFMVKGAVTTPSGVTTPMVGPLGTVNTFISGVISPLTFMQKIREEPFFEQLVSCINDILRTSIVTVDIKPIGATIPMTVPFSTVLNMQQFGKSLELNMKALKCADSTSFYMALDVQFETIWSYILASEVFYSSPCVGGVFNGTITFTGLSLAV